MAQDEAAGDGVVGAFFDVDGTLASSNLVNVYLDFNMGQRGIVGKGLLALGFAPKLPYYALVDRFSRSRFNQIFFKNYDGVSLIELRSWASQDGLRYWSSRLYHEGLQEIGRHREEGHKIVLVTGGLSETLQPLGPLLDADGVAAVEAESAHGHLTGRLALGPLTGVAKAEEVRRLAAVLGIDLARSYAYADSFSDLAFLESVAYPIAVNPDRKLRRHAKARGWGVQSWRKRGAGGFPSLRRILNSR